MKQDHLKLAKAIADGVTIAHEGGAEGALAGKLHRLAAIARAFQPTRTATRPRHGPPRG